MTDSVQAIVNKYSCDVFGNIENQQENIPQPFKFVGQFGVMTEPNGFYYMRARYYDPSVGRFISEDPIGFEGGTVNLYEYVGNNPVIKIDPNGLWVLPLIRVALSAYALYETYRAIEKLNKSAEDYGNKLQEFADKERSGQVTNKDIENLYNSEGQMIRDAGNAVKSGSKMSGTVGSGKRTPCGNQ